MTLRITIEVGEKEFSDEGELFHPDIRAKIELEQLRYENLEGYESDAIILVRKTLKEIKQQLEFKI